MQQGHFCIVNIAPSLLHLADRVQSCRGGADRLASYKNRLLKEKNFKLLLSLSSDY